jgi:hypothetical protein
VFRSTRKQPSIAERRRLPRIEVKGATAKIDSKSFPLKNLSISGFLLSPYDGDLVARQRVYLTLMLKIDGQDQDYLTDAVIVRLGTGGLAGRFNDLRKDARRAIERLLTLYQTGVPVRE